MADQELLAARIIGVKGDWVTVSYPKGVCSKMTAWNHLEHNYPPQVPTKKHNMWRRVHSPTHWQWSTVIEGMILGHRVQIPTYPILPAEKRLSPSEEVSLDLDKEVCDENSPNFDIQPAMGCAATGGTVADPFEEEHLRRYSEKVENTEKEDG